MNKILWHVIDFLKLAFSTGIGNSVEEYYNKKKPDSYYLNKAIDESTQYLLDNYNDRNKT